MLLNFRTIANKLYQMEFEPTDTVKACKSKLAPVCGFHPGKIRLIFKARLLNDNVSLGSCGIEANGFIVVHGVPLEEPPSTPPSPKPAVVEAGPTCDPLPSIETNRGRPDPPEFTTKVENLRAMGFGRCDCEIALRAALGNVDRAADFLLSGHTPSAPRLLSTEEIPVSDDGDSAGSDDDGEDEEEDFEGDEGDQAARLRRFAKFRDRLIRDPILLRQFLREMAEANPSLASLIQDDPAAFLGSIGLNPDDFDLSGLGKRSPYETLMAEFSEPEQRSIRALEKLGFDTMTVIQVFVACDRQESLTKECLHSMR
jgi:UV excision repair protein RAD23